MQAIADETASNPNMIWNQIDHNSFKEECSPIMSLWLLIKCTMEDDYRASKVPSPVILENHSKIKNLPSKVKFKQ